MNKKLVLGIIAGIVALIIIAVLVSIGFVVFCVSYIVSNIAGWLLVNPSAVWLAILIVTAILSVICFAVIIYAEKD